MITSFQKYKPLNVMGQKLPLKIEQVWSICARLELANNIRNLALFNLAIDSMLRSCDLVKLLVSDISHGDGIQSRAQIIQKKTKTPVQFEITKKTKDTLSKLIDAQSLGFNYFIFRSRCKKYEQLSTRQYARIVDCWVCSIGLNKAAYGTHSMRRTKASIIYRETKNLRAVQILLGHSKIDSTIRYLGVEIDDALDLAEQIQV